MPKTLTETEAREIIRAGKIGRLGCINGDGPYVVPINYVLDEGSIYSHSLPGRKIDAMRTHSRVCLQVDQLEDDFHWRSSIAFGKFEEVHNSEDRRSILHKMLSRFPRLTPVESMVVQDPSSPQSIVFRIVIDQITGVEEA